MEEGNSSLRGGEKRTGSRQGVGGKTGRRGYRGTLDLIWYE